LVIVFVGGFDIGRDAVEKAGKINALGTTELQLGKDKDGCAHQSQAGPKDFTARDKNGKREQEDGPEPRGE